MMLRSGLRFFLGMTLFISLAVSARPHAGLSGLGAAADSALTAGTNPAGISRFREKATHVELLAFFSESTWEGRVGGNGPEFRSTNSSEIVVPSGYMVRPINDRYSFGFTILGSGFSDDLGDWPGKYFIQSYDSIYISAFPSLAYRVNDKLSIAGSLAITYSIFDQEKAVANIFDPSYGDGTATLETDGFDAGFGLSMLYQVSDQTRWGLMYQSGSEPTLEGKVKYRGLGPNTEAVLREAGFIGADVEVKSKSPQSVLGGIYHEFNNGHALTADLVWADFSEFQLSEFYFDGEGLVDNEGNYEDIWAISVGYTWPVSSRWMLGVAGMYVDDMIEDDERTVTLRLDSLWSIDAAAEWRWREDRTVQMGFSYMEIGDAPVVTPAIPIVGPSQGKFTRREVIMLRFGLSFGGL